MLGILYGGTLGAMRNLKRSRAKRIWYIVHTFEQRRVRQVALIVSNTKRYNNPFLQALHSHCRAKGHKGSRSKFYCGQCKRWFPHTQVLLPRIDVNPKLIPYKHTRHSPAKATVEAATGRSSTDKASTST